MGEVVYVIVHALGDDVWVAGVCRTQDRANEKVAEVEEENPTHDVWWEESHLE